MVAATIASGANSCSPNPDSASAPIIRHTPAMPDTTPKSFRIVTGSCRVIAAVSKKTKIGDVELSTVASPASTRCSPQAISVNGMALFRQAWMRNRRHVTQSRGN